MLHQVGVSFEMRSTESLSSIKGAITTLFDQANAIKKENEVEGIKYKKGKQKEQGYGREKIQMQVELYRDGREKGWGLVLKIKSSTARNVGIFDRRSSNGDTAIAQIHYLRFELLDIRSCCWRSKRVACAQ